MRLWPWWRTSKQYTSNNSKHNKITYALLAQTDSHILLGSETISGVATAAATDEYKTTMRESSYNIENNDFLDNFDVLTNDNSDSKGSFKLKKKICIGFVLLAVLVLCASAFLLLRNEKTTPVSGKLLKADALVAKSSVLLNDYLDNKLYPKRSNATWISNTEILYKDSTGNVELFNVETNRSTVIGADNHVVLMSFTQELSPDRRYLLLGRDYQKIFRHSAVARYLILDLETDQVQSLNEKYLLLASWGPAGNSIVFVHDNNIFFKPSVEKPAIQITDDGNENVFNGVCDWVYEEEVFSTKTAVWLSPNVTKMAFVRFDDSPVRRMQIPVYGIPGRMEYQYPSDFSVPYPKAGSPNPYIKLFFVDLEQIQEDSDVEKIEIPPPEPLRDIEHIISVVAWANDDVLFSNWMNRVQNESYTQTCRGRDCKLLLETKSLTGWIEFFKAPTFNTNGSQFVYLASQKQTNNDSYRHVTLVSTETGQQTALTTGNFVVDKILHWDLKNNLVFYAANIANNSHVKHIYAVQSNDVANGTHKQICLTCNITQNGILQTVFSAEFSPNSQYILLSTDGPSMPRTDIVSYKFNSTNGHIDLKFRYNWEDNDALKESLKNVSTPQIKYLQLPLKSGFEAAVRLQLPPNADLSGNTKYPMLVDVYAGPGSYAGLDNWECSFATYLTTSRSYIYAQINGRGSGGRSDELLHTIYRSMGTVEVEDQLEGVKELAKKFAFIDAKRVGIWGWSYGGFASGMALARDKERVLKCAASVAPVTDWTYYDSIYTERYMGLPTANDNMIGYANSRLSTIPHLFENKTYLLVHGSLDDNVHYQQSAALARSLEINDIPFEQITYPDEDHSLWGVRKHLYHALDSYFNKCFTTE